MRAFTFSGARGATRLRRAVLAVIAAGGLAACDGDEVIDPPFRDTVKPRVTMSRGVNQADSLLQFSVTARDDIGLKKIRVQLTGGFTAAIDTTFNSAIQEFTYTITARVPSSAPLGSTVIVESLAEDGAGNQSDTANLVLTVGNLTPPSATITSPVSGSPVVTGKALVLSLSGRAQFKVRTLGYVTTGAFRAADSMGFSVPLRDSVAALDTLVIPDSVSGTSLTVTPFIVDSLNQRVLGTPVTYPVQRPDQVNSVPTVTTGVARRLEVSDTIFVEATDPVGITTLGYEVRTLTGALVRADSIQSNGSFSTLVRTFETRIPITTFPTPVTVQGFARNSNGRRDVARQTSGGVRIDTAVVVAGYTRPLPTGGQIADAIYFPRNNRLYLSNIERNQLEVYNLADSSFRQPIFVGSRPWGIAAWPRNRDGVMGDTLLVANSGGTTISYVDLRRGATGQEVYRYPLPNIIAYSVTSVRSEQTDEVITQRTVYDFSDRPQYLASTCTGGSASGSACQDVVLVYSTTPTPGQTLPFARKGTVRWENLTRATSHFFFEQAMGQTANRADTLEIERYAAGGVGSDSTLVPFAQRIPLPDGSFFNYSIVIRIDQLAFRDTTYVRNSGNFRRAVVGEGGPVLGSRGMMYDALTGFDMLPPLPVIDRGVSRAMDVSDYIANSFARVQGVAINFDGELAAIKGDSTYVFDRTLRLQGIFQSLGSTGGLDFHPQNRGLNSPTLQSRLAFVASAEPVIDVYDSWCFKRVASVPIRDPIIGPVRASQRSDGAIVLVGATLRGVTLVELPNNFSTICN
ncbi:MAG: hypothetical protein MUD17_02555 [Gemmatimonadaceae bacterium]|jgi:hypothetical protein|nr:hypothetical protein [Gemmatimonadaceae bacterium]